MFSFRFRSRPWRPSRFLSKMILICAITYFLPLSFPSRLIIRQRHLLINVCRRNNQQTEKSANNGLSGTIPIEIQALSNLQLLHLRNNSLMGSIPRSVTNKLSQLTSLDLGENRLSSVSLPSNVVGNLHQLQHLRLDNSFLKSTITLSMSSLTVSTRANWAE